MPGVTITATSPALIERSKTAISDAAGRGSSIYALGLRRHVQLAGFQTVKSENIALEANFTATVNAELHVGASRKHHGFRCVAAGGHSDVNEARGSLA